MSRTLRKPRLYVTDLDGTLLGQDGRVSEKSKSMLRALLAEGVRITVATGRAPQSLGCVAEIPWSAPLVPLVYRLREDGVYAMTVRGGGGRGQAPPLRLRTALFEQGLHAHSDVRAAADLVVGANDQDGVAQAIWEMEREAMEGGKGI